jgi:hypothetical protein
MSDDPTLMFVAGFVVGAVAVGVGALLGVRAVLKGNLP